MTKNKMEDKMIPCSVPELGELFLNSQHSDASITTSNGERIPIHKSVVILQVPELAKEFGDDNHYDSPFDSAVMKPLLEFLYTGDYSVRKDHLADKGQQDGMAKQHDSANQGNIPDHSSNAKQDGITERDNLKKTASKQDMTMQDDIHVASGDSLAEKNAVPKQDNVAFQDHAVNENGVTEQRDASYFGIDKKASATKHDPVTIEGDNAVWHSIDEQDDIVKRDSTAVGRPSDGPPTKKVKLSFEESEKVTKKEKDSHEPKTKVFKMARVVRDTPGLKPLGVATYHARLSCVADFYNLPKLQELALDRLKQTFKKWWNADVFYSFLEVECMLRGCMPKIQYVPALGALAANLAAFHIEELLAGERFGGECFPRPFAPGMAHALKDNLGNMLTASTAAETVASLPRKPKGGWKARRGQGHVPRQSTNDTQAPGHAAELRKQGLGLNASEAQRFFQMVDICNRGEWLCPFCPDRARVMLVPHFKRVGRETYSLECSGCRSKLL